ncbi:MAG: tetratricopeptide repeat protein [Deltaproteobacteria bacterium]|nr:tetratricopeptide repeat protein [Deltaproteobacteria bacterium]
MAILIDQMAPILKDWKVEILATDINAHFLKKAKEGVYTQWSFRNTPDRLKDAYFRQTGKNRFEISSHIKEMVAFYQLNLIEKDRFSLPGNSDAMDVIFCRNVLMYLSPEMRTHVIRRLTRLLGKDGWFIVSSSENAFVEHPELQPVRFPGAVLHRKGLPGKCDPKSIRPVHVTPKFVPATRSHVAGSSPKREESDMNRGGVSRPVHGSTRGEGPLRESIVSREKERRRTPPKDLYQEGCRLYENGRYDDVVERFYSVLSPGPDNNGDGPLPPVEMVLLAKALANLGRLDEAKKWCDQAIQNEKLRPDHHYLLATILQEQGDMEGSIAALKQVLYLDPEFVMAHFTLGNLTREQGRLNESRKYFKNAQDLLSSGEPGELVPYSDGVTAERLNETIRWIIEG